MRGEQLARQWRILRHIEGARHGLTVAEIADLEGIAPRTAYRDVEALEQAGFPLFAERVEGTNRWAFVDTYKFQVPQPFTLTELMSLHLYGDLVRVFKGTAFYDSLESLFKKVRSTLPPRTLEYLGRIESAFSVGIKPYKDYARFREIMNQVNQAITEGRRLEMAYHPLRRDKETLRVVDPYKIWFFEGTLYLIGFCRLRGEVRMFVLDRIRMLRLTDELFEYPQDFDVHEFMGDSFKVMQGETHTVVVRISPEWSRWAGEKIWHESQKSRHLEDGSLELTFRVAGLDEIMRWVLSLGREAYVLEPEALQEMLRDTLKKTLARYDDGLEHLGDTEKVKRKSS
ncbi:MAG: WYL domain-containing transcriptional regulator [bacterium]